MSDYIYIPEEFLPYLRLHVILITVYMLLESSAGLYIVLVEFILLAYDSNYCTY